AARARRLRFSTLRGEAPHSQHRDHPAGLHRSAVWGSTRRVRHRSPRRRLLALTATKLSRSTLIPPLPLAHLNRWLRLAPARGLAWTTGAGRSAEAGRGPGSGREPASFAALGRWRGARVGRRLAGLGGPCPRPRPTVVVTSVEELQRAVKDAVPGSIIEVAP